MNPHSAAIESVAQALGDLKERCLLAGGASIPYYITDALVEKPRYTDDIDLIIEVRTRPEFHAIETELRRRDFANDIRPGAPRHIQRRYGQNHRGMLLENAFRAIRTCGKNGGLLG